MLKKNITEEVVFGGGCFWCTEAIFKQINGVIDVSSGYSGGTEKNPTYEDICSGQTGYAEVVRILFNPDKIAFEKLLEVFFLTHDPTTLNRQGSDIGAQYRSVVFYTTPDQKKITQEVIAKLNESRVYQTPIVTEVTHLDTFYLAENYHQNYFDLNRKQPYCRFVIQPKMDKFRKLFDGLLKK
jgi:peptide-methionine (S)-S-oxide reductase